MNNTLPFSASASTLDNQAAPRPIPARSAFVRLLQTIAAFFVSRDEPAALRYAVGKYAGSRD
jgi:hypothetical protein